MEELINRLENKIKDLEQRKREALTMESSKENINYLDGTIDGLVLALALVKNFTFKR